METGSRSYRPAVESDRDFLKYMLELTETWGDPEKEIPDHFETDLDRYVTQWDPSQGGVILEISEPGEAQHRRIGAAWFRLFTQDAPGYGFVSEKYPEVAIAIIPEYMGKGFGPELLKEALDQARAAGHPGVSLSVEVGNERATKTYEKLGFENRGLDDGGEAYTMLHIF